MCDVWGQNEMVIKKRKKQNIQIQHVYEVTRGARVIFQCNPRTIQPHKFVTIQPPPSYVFFYPKN